MKATHCFFILSFNRVASVKGSANYHLVASVHCLIGIVYFTMPKPTLTSVQLVLQRKTLMPLNNHDKGLPTTPAVDSETKIPILTNNFTPTAPTNPILWGPNQPWVDINTYKKPTNWRYKELLSIPRVSRMVVAKSDPCIYPSSSGHAPLMYILSSFGGTGITASGLPFNMADGLPNRITDTFTIFLDTGGDPKLAFKNGFWRILRYYDIGTSLGLHPPENFVRIEATGGVDAFGQFTGTGVTTPGGVAQLVKSTDGFDATFVPAHPADNNVTDVMTLELSSDGLSWSSFPFPSADWPGS